MLTDGVAVLVIGTGALPGVAARRGHEIDDVGLLGVREPDDEAGGRLRLDVDVLEVGTYDRRLGTVTGGLTDRQFEALETASELGYYAVPREASLSDVAAELDIAPSTASELLRRAESRVLPRLVGADGPSRTPEQS